MAIKSNENPAQSGELADEIEVLETRRSKLLVLLEKYDRLTKIFHDYSSYGIFRDMAKIGKQLDETDQQLSTFRQKVSQNI